MLASVLNLRLIAGAFGIVVGAKGLVVLASSTFWPQLTGVSETLVQTVLMATIAAPLAFYHIRREIHAAGEHERQTREQVQRRLAESEAMFRTLADSSPIFVWTSGTDGERLYFNRTWLDFRGRTLEQESGKGWMSGVHPDDLERYNRTLYQAYANRESFEIEYRLLRRDGVYRTILGRGVPRFDAEGRFVGFVGACSDLTEQHEIERHIAESEAMFRTLADSSPIFVWTSGIDGERVYFNRTWLDFRGRTLEQESGRGWMSGVHPDDLERYRAVLDDAYQRGCAFEIEYRLQRHDGVYRTILGRGVPRSNTEGRFAGFVGACSDLTEMRLVEQRVAESESRFRAIVDGPDLFAWEFCVEEDRFTYVSFEDERCGYPRRDWLEPGFWNALLHREDANRTRTNFIRDVREGRAQRLSYRVRSRGGAVVHINDYVSAPQTVGGRTIVRGVALDVSEQRRAVERLAESEAMFRTLADSAPIFVWTSDARGRRTYFNRHWLEFRGRTLEQESGDGWAEGAHPDDRERCQQVVIEATAERRSFQFEYRLKRFDGVYRHILARGEPLISADGEFSGYVGACTDFTEVREAQAKAEAASRAKSEFLANMSHEIRTPLTAILGFADILREEPDHAIEPEQRSQSIESIRTAGQHLLAVINDILDLSKIEAGRVEIERIETSIPRMVDEAVGMVRPRAAAKGVRLELAVAAPVHDLVFTDPTRLRQVLTNLVGNAIKFTECGSITVTLDRVSDPSGERLRIDVADTGAGMTPTQIDKLFRPFSQADSTTTRRHGGTGLGLTISRRLANLMGGDVRLLRTEPGQGSCFRIEVRAEPAPGARLITSIDHAAGAPEAGVREPAASLQGRVLLAEDGPDNQRLIAFHLRRAGASVEIAENGRVALEMIERAAAAGERFDLLLSDMQMPEMDGYTLASTLRARGNDIAIVVLTAHAMSDDRQKCLDAGCDDYATKPIDRRLLLATCSKWIGRRSGRAVRSAA